MKWQIKFLKNALFGMLPFKYSVRKAKRYFFIKKTVIDAWVIEQGLRQIEMLRNSKYSVRGKIVLEIGTGWFPIIPVLFYLAGCKEIILVDTEKLLDMSSVKETINGILSYKEMISKGIGVSIEEIDTKLFFNEYSSLKLLLEKFNMRYMAPYKLSTNNVMLQSVDLIISRAVFEHIPVDILFNLLNECKRILKYDGRMCHIIDNSDHWEHEDKSITRLNFLKFNEKAFALISSFNPLDYQNRLRHYEYLNLFEKTGFKVDFDYSKVDTKALADLVKIKLSEKYRNVAPEALAILTSYLVLSRGSK